jgi:hypothetical protein
VISFLPKVIEKELLQEDTLVVLIQKIQKKIVKLDIYFYGGIKLEHLGLRGIELNPYPL